MLLYPIPHIDSSSGEPLDDILIDDTDKKKYQNMSREQRKQKWIQSFCSQYGGFYRPALWPFNLTKFKEKRDGVADDIEEYIPVILANWTCYNLNDIFETTAEEKGKILPLIEKYIQKSDEEIGEDRKILLHEKDDLDNIADTQNIRKEMQLALEGTKKEDEILATRTEKQKQYISRGNWLYYRRGEYADPFNASQRFWNEEFLDEAKKGNLPITWSEFVEIWSFLDKNLEQYIPGIIEYLHKNGYKKRLEDVFILTPKEREDLTNMFTFGYQMQDTQTGILDRVRKLVSRKKTQ